MKKLLLMHAQMIMNTVIATFSITWVGLIAYYIITNYEQVLYLMGR